MLEYDVLPEDTVVFGTQWVPAAGKADEPGVEPVHLRELHQLLLAPPMIRADQRDGVCDLESSQVALDGGPRDAESGRGACPLELSAALAEDVLEKRREAV